MLENDEKKIPNPKEIEKEIGDFLSQKFGDRVKIVSPIVMPEEMLSDEDSKPKYGKQKIQFDLLPLELINYLDQYIIKQDQAKAILSTKICTHFNRIQRAQTSNNSSNLVGNIKNNVLLIGPTGVGKTYIIKLIAQKIGVPFVKGDATKFSETGYVGGDVEDLVRDLVREANEDIELAQYGIIYIDEIDKIASSNNFIGADVSRTGVQRALLTPMEETEVEMKVPHDPISMIQEIERFRKTGKKDKRTINTKNILFIMSGAFSGLSEIIQKRISNKSIGFKAQIADSGEESDLLKKVKTQDLITYGFESEFVGRLPVRATLDRLTKDDLFDILKNPNNPIMLGKKLDFAAYGIDIKFEEKVLHKIAEEAYSENTGARGLVSAVEKELLHFEKELPSTPIKKFPVFLKTIEKPLKALENFKTQAYQNKIDKNFEALTKKEKKFILSEIQKNRKNLEKKYKLTLTSTKQELVAELYSRHTVDIQQAINHIKTYCEDIKKIELYFFKKQDINIVLEEDTIDYIIEQIITNDASTDDFYQQLNTSFEYGFKLVAEKTGQNRFFITKDALLNPDNFIAKLLKPAT